MVAYICVRNESLYTNTVHSVAGNLFSHTRARIDSWFCMEKKTDEEQGLATPLMEPSLRIKLDTNTTGGKNISKSYYQGSLQTSCILVYYVINLCTCICNIV